MASLCFTVSHHTLSLFGPLCSFFRVWKLNPAILSEPTYDQAVTSFWSVWQTKKLDFITIIDWWETAKTKLKGLTVAYCKDRAAKKRQSRQQFVNLIAHLKNHIDNGRVSSIGPYRSALAKLRKLDSDTAAGAKIRARVRWMEEGECSFAFFCRLERKKASDLLISVLRGSDGLLCSGQEGLASILMDFYSSLFTKEDVDLNAQQRFLSKISDQLPSACAQDCECPLTVAECFTGSQWNSTYVFGTYWVKILLRFLILAMRLESCLRLRGEGL